MPHRSLMGFVLLAVLASAGVLATGCSESKKRSLREPTEKGATDDDPEAKDAGSKKKKPTKNKPPPKDDDNTVEEEAPTDPETSGGSGGQTGFGERKSQSGLSYLIDAPADSASLGKPYGLVVFLHGSSASNYTKFIQDAAAVTKEFRLLPVSVLAPNGQGWNEGGEQEAAKKLHDLIQQDILPRYNIATARIVFSGQSSGGGFLSTHFVPLYAPSYKGGAFMMCGAAAPAVNFAPDDDTKAAFKLHFEITKGDPIWPTSYAEAIAAYTKAGMTLTKDNTKPGGHCAFDQAAVIKTHIKDMIAVP